MCCTANVGKSSRQFLRQRGRAGLDSHLKPILRRSDSHLGRVPGGSQRYMRPVPWQHMLKAIVMASFFDQSAL